jgi:coenzyme PQQ precursor peptide PqqA
MFVVPAIKQDYEVLQFSYKRLIKLLKKTKTIKETAMNWVAPIVEEICVGMEVTSYESADLPVEF